MLRTMRYIRRITYLLLLCCMLPVQAQTLRVINDVWPPFSDASLQQHGLIPELLSLIFSDQDYQISYQEYPWTRVLRMAQAGEADIISGLWYTDERSEYLLYSNPVYVSQLKFLKRADDGFDYHNDLEALRGKIIGIVSNYQYGEDFYDADYFLRQPARDLHVNIDRLIHRRIDLTLGLEGVLKAAIEQLPHEQQQQLELVDTPLKSVPVFIACAKANKNCERIITTFNNKLERYKDSGVYTRLVGKYGLHKKGHTRLCAAPDSNENC